MLLDYIKQIKNHKINTFRILYYLFRCCLLGMWYLKGLDSCRVKLISLGFTLNKHTQPLSHMLGPQQVPKHHSHPDRPSDINVTGPSLYKFTVPLTYWNKFVKYTYLESQSVNRAPSIWEKEVCLCFISTTSMKFDGSISCAN
jgi:hypothetical protein